MHSGSGWFGVNGLGCYLLWCGQIIQYGWYLRIIHCRYQIIELQCFHWRYFHIYCKMLPWASWTFLLVVIVIRQTVFVTVDRGICKERMLGSSDAGFTHSTPTPFFSPQSHLLLVYKTVYRHGRVEFEQWITSFQKHKQGNAKSIQAWIGCI